MSHREVTTKDGTEETPALFPQASAQSAVKAAEMGEHAPSLRTLHSVTHTPMMRPDGTVLVDPGYDPSTGYLYLPKGDGLSPAAIPSYPTAQEIKSAVDFILTPFAEFPFVSEDDRATYLGLLFTPALHRCSLAHINWA